MSNLNAHPKRGDINQAKELRNGLHWLQTGIKGIHVLGCSPLTLQNFPWCEVWRNLMSCERTDTGTARSSTRKMPPDAQIRLRFWFIGTRPSQARPTPYKATQPRPICISTTCLKDPYLPWPYCWLWRGNIRDYQVQRLLHYSPQHLDTHYYQQRINYCEEAKLVPPPIVSATCWYTCFRRHQIPIRKLWIHQKGQMA